MDAKTQARDRTAPLSPEEQEVLTPTVVAESTWYPHPVVEHAVAYALQESAPVTQDQVLELARELCRCNGVDPDSYDGLVQKYGWEHYVVDAKTAWSTIQPGRPFEDDDG